MNPSPDDLQTANELLFLKIVKAGLPKEEEWKNTTPLNITMLG